MSKIPNRISGCERDHVPEAAGRARGSAGPVPLRGGAAGAADPAATAAATAGGRRAGHPGEPAAPTAAATTTTTTATAAGAARTAGTMMIRVSHSFSHNFKGGWPSCMGVASG